MNKKIAALFLLPCTVLSANKTTSIYTYQPTFNATLPVFIGKCWTHSIRNSRSDAWRCMVDNRIYDPCFQIKNHPELICQGQNATHAFHLQLTQPLPKMINKKTKITHLPERVQLNNGLVCERYTGTMAVINDPAGKILALAYGCKKNKPFPSNHHYGLLADSIKPNDSIWQAIAVHYQPSSTTATKWQVVDMQPVTINKIFN